MKLSTLYNDSYASKQRELGQKLANAALADCSSALSLEKSAAALVCRAQVYQRRAAYGDLRSDKYLELEDEEQAVVDYKEAIRVDPGFLPAYTGLAQLYEFKKSSLSLITNPFAKLAIEYYSKAIQLQPKNVGGLLLQRGMLYERQGDSAQAMVDYSAAVANEPTNTAAYRLRARLYKQSQDYTKAGEDYRIAIGLEPEQPYNWQLLAEVFVAWSRYDEAVTAYTEALQRVELVTPSSKNWQAAQLLEARGDVLVTKGVRDAAREDYQQAMKLYPLRAEDLKKKLQSLDMPASEEERAS